MAPPACPGPGSRGRQATSPSRERNNGRGSRTVAYRHLRRTFEHDSVVSMQTDSLLPAMATVSIVIRALNEAEHLPALFSGLLRQTRQPDQVILVDSGSVDDTVAIARAHGAEVVHIAPAEFSFGRALNLGCAARDRRHLGDRQRPRVPARREVARPDGRAVRASRGRPRLRRPDRRQPQPLLRARAAAHVVPRRQRRRPADPVLQQRQLRRARRGVAGAPLRRDADRAGGPRLGQAGPRRRVEARLRRPTPASPTSTTSRSPRRATATGARRSPTGGSSTTSTSTCSRRSGCSCSSTGRDYLAAAARRRLWSNLASIPRFRAAQYLGTWEGFRHRGEVSTSLRRRFYYPKGFTGLDRSSRDGR